MIVNSWGNQKSVRSPDSLSLREDQHCDAQTGECSSPRCLMDLLLLLNQSYHHAAPVMLFESGELWEYNWTINLRQGQESCVLGKKSPIDDTQRWRCNEIHHATSYWDRRGYLSYIHNLPPATHNKIHHNASFLEKVFVPLNHDFERLYSLVVLLTILVFKKHHANVYYVWRVHTEALDSGIGQFVK